MTETDDIAEQSIRDTNRYIRKLLQQEIFDTTRWVRGIVAEVYLSDKGHLYFNLKDDNYSIRCNYSACFNSENQFIANDISRK